MKAYETKKKLALSLAVAMVASSAPVLAFADTAIVAQAEAEMTVEEIIASVSAAINDPFLAAGLARIEAGEAAVATLPDGATKTALTETLQTARHMYDGLEQINQIWVALGAAGWQTNYKTEVAELQAIIAQLDAAFPGGSAFLNNFKTAVTETGLTYAAFEAMDVAAVNPTAANIAAAKEAVSKIMNPVAKANAELRIETEIENQKLAVVSVSAINATQVEVKFNAKVDKTTAIVNGNYTATPLDGQTATVASAALKEDGKTVVVTFNQPLAKRYQFKVANVKLASDLNVTVSYDDIVTFKADTTAPTATVERVSTNAFKIKFSEPMKASAGNASVKYADGTAVTGLTVTIPSSTYTEIAVNLSASTITANKNIEVTLNGVADMAGNLINPQPAKLTVVKLPDDAIEPTITSVTQTGAKTFSIKFNKDLDGNIAAADVTVGGTAATGTVKKISASEYEFTMAANLDGLQTVTVAATKAVDLAGQKNANALTKLVTFKEDTKAPKATAKLVNVNNKEYIQLTFDNNVTAGNVTVAGSQVKDYVTTTGISETVAAVYADGTGTNKKVINIPLTAVALAVEDAVYDLTVSSTAVKSDAGVDMDNVKVQFTRGKDGETANSNIVTGVTVAQGSTPDEVKVTFTMPEGAKLDGATATNKSNYEIAGAQVDSVNLAAPTHTGGNPSTQVATVKLVKNSNTFTGTRNITVKNVKVDGSTKVMNSFTENTVSLKENVRPTITKAELTATDKVTLTFSEAVITNAGTTDFELLIGGKTVSTNDQVTTATNVSPGVTTVEFTLETDVTAEDIASGLSLKALSTMGIVDAAGNKVEATTVNVTTN